MTCLQKFLPISGVKTLKSKAKQQRYSLSAFANEIVVTETGLKGMFRNEDMKLSVFERACRVLGVSPCLFFDDHPSFEVNEPQASYSATADTGKLVELYEENRKLHHIILD